MKNCLLCNNLGKHCTCEHCEGYDNFVISKEGNLIINQIRKEEARKICSKIIKGQPQPIKEKWVEWFKKKYGVDLGE